MKRVWGRNHKSPPPSTWQAMRFLSAKGLPQDPQERSSLTMDRQSASDNKLPEPTMNGALNILYGKHLNSVKEVL